MKLSGRYFYIYAFTAFIFGFAFMVGLNTSAATRGMKALSEDASELVEMTNRAARAADFGDVSEVILTLHAASLFMPSALFASVRKELRKVSRGMR
ncbi:hypothetical protein V6575_18300 [Roseibium sp. H3510]|uniref:Uncharacterized protein n=2 Tax=Roseibium algae TaxID=3123038 RepID=A0ABU8TPF1_9HYPH